MNTKKNLLFATLFLSSFLCFSQQMAQNIIKKSEKKPFTTFKINDSFNLNQSIFSFLKNRGDFNNCEREKINAQFKLGTTINEVDKSYREKRFGYTSQNVSRIFLDDSEILGIGINRLYLLDQLRLEDFSFIYISNPGYDKEIYLFSKK